MRIKKIGTLNAGREDQLYHKLSGTKSTEEKMRKRQSNNVVKIQKSLYISW